MPLKMGKGQWFSKPTEDIPQGETEGAKCFPANQTEHSFGLNVTLIHRDIVVHIN
jgi:hypothetical protein